MKCLKNITLLFSIGAIGYCSLEILWRGHTHWTMGVTGGMCFLSLFDMNKKLKRQRLWEKCIIGSAIITSFEFLVGVLVNRVLHWHVWDYSMQRGNILGQICPLYSLLWFFLCIPLCRFCQMVEKWLSHPSFRLFSRQFSSK